MWKVLCALMIVASMIFAGCGSDKKAQSSSSSAKVQVETSSSGEKQATAEKRIGGTGTNIRILRCPKKNWMY